MAKEQRGSRIFPILLIVALVFVSYMWYDTNKSLNYCSADLAQLEQLEWLKEQGVLDKPDLSGQLYDSLQKNQELYASLNQKDIAIRDLQTKQTKTEAELETAKTQLRETQAMLEEEKLKCQEPVEEPAANGLNFNEISNLFIDSREFARPAILNYLGFANKVAPTNDDQLWERAEKVYEWISQEFDFCRDAGLTEQSTYLDFKFSSPDQVLDPEEDEQCGDVDDYALLFASMMYLSGVDESDLTISCSGNHCWNLIIKREKPYEGWYVIDSSCTQPYALSKYYGVSTSKKSIPGFWQNVKCFNDYTPEIIFNPNFYKDKLGTTHLLR